MSKTQSDKKAKTGVSEQKETTRSQPGSKTTLPGRVPDLKPGNCSDGHPLDWLSLGTTKTGLVYRLRGNAPQAHE